MRPLSILRRPPARRRASFTLTPLIDVMFLLLIFFMLSSQISPYSLLPVRDVAAGREEQEARGDAAPRRDAVVRVSRGIVAVDGSVVAAADAPAVFRRSVASGTAAFLVVASGSASVQDLVSVLEGLDAARAASVTLVGAGRTSP